MLQFWGNPRCFSGNESFEACCLVNMGAREIFPQSSCWPKGWFWQDCCEGTWYGLRGRYDLPWVRRNSWLFRCDTLIWDQLLLAAKSEQDFLRTAWDHARTRLDSERYLSDEAFSSIMDHGKDDCPLGQFLMKLAMLMVMPDGTDSSAVEAPLVYNAVIEKLQELADTMDGAQLFAVTGHTITQIRYVLFGTPSLLRVPSRPFLPPRAFPQRDGQRGKVLELGMGGGLNALSFLLHGYEVIGVEAHPEMLERSVRPLLGTYESTGWLKLIHAAVAPGLSKNQKATFFLHPHFEKGTAIAGAFEEEVRTQGMKPWEVRPVQVPRTSCQELLKSWGHDIIYLKADTQGMDAACAMDMDASLAPPFASFELPDPLSNASMLAEAHMLVAHLSHIGYVGFKICRQRPYYSRCWGERCHLAVDGGIGKLVDGWGVEPQPWTLGLSGPFGQGAVDWRRGEAWRRVEEVMGDFLFLGAISRRYNEHFDVHATRTMQ
eukprot:gnl/MRDRNA2_/MRDRNA2_19980_c0_seq1.p1 gnl/MRDRNA2_/MRDRNA2_19980_c0~~gnl/MRDRNA2_/MRDRNA2_19980_c0_seq1.p1  ORF type:complete len:489 (-),score=64.36 gnl/MRDRNA2_/MRDRNA2_19980_c0_seq1:8-1474(-)